MLEVLPLGAIRAVPLPLPLVGSETYCFAVITGGDSRGNERRAAGIATVVENAVIADDFASQRTLPARNGNAIQARFTAVIRQIQTCLRRSVTDETAGIGVCLGIAYSIGDRTAISLSSAGNIAAIVIPQWRPAHDVAKTMLVIEPADGPMLRFSHVVDGAINPHDILLIGSAALILTDTRSAIANACATATDTTGLRRALEQISRTVPVVMIVRANVDRLRRSQTSMDAFLATAATTKNFLTPTLVPALRNYAAHIAATLASATRRRSSRRASRKRILPLFVEATNIALHTIVIGFRSIGVILFDGLRLIVIAVALTARVLRHVRFRQSAVTLRLITHRLLAGVTRPQRALRLGVALTDRWRSRYHTLSATSRRLFLLTVIFASLFVISTAALWRRRTAEMNVITYNEIIASIEELRSVGEARLLFDDRVAARAAFAEAAARLETLPRTSQARRERAALLDSEIQTSLDRARKIARIREPLRVTRAGAGLPWQTIGAFAAQGQRLVAVSDDRRQLATINSRTGETIIRDLRPMPSLAAPFRLYPLDDRSLLLVDANTHAAIIDAQTGNTSVAIIEQPPTEIRDAAIYNGRLYLLHGDGTITRHARVAAGFARGTTWLSRDRANSDARTLAVAGPIFVGASNGAVTTYFAGRQRETNVIKDVDPPLTSAALLMTPTDREILYLGYPTDGRIIAVRYDGELVGQIQSDDFKGLTGLALDQSGQSLYVLHGADISIVIPPNL